MSNTTEYTVIIPAGKTLQDLKGFNADGSPRFSNSEFPDPAPTSPRQPVSAERLTKDNVLRHWRTCEDGITCMEPAFGRNREEADWVKFSDFAQVVDERDEAYRSASLPVTPELPGAKVIHDKRGHLLAFDPECEECVKGLNQAKSEAASLPVTPNNLTKENTMPNRNDLAINLYSVENDPAAWEKLDVSARALWFRLAEAAIEYFRLNAAQDAPRQT